MWMSPAICSIAAIEDWRLELIGSSIVASIGFGEGAVERRSEFCGSLILFLDFDDVVCLNSPVGGYDVALALASHASPSSETLNRPEITLWDQVFDSAAVGLLRLLHNEFQPQYVLSTSWWWLMEDALLIEAMVRGGMGFVASNLHPASTTPKGPRPGTRWTEINGWLEAHPEYSDRWVVLDDELSGSGLASAQTEPRSPFIVLCSANVGLTQAEYQRLRTAFLTRAANVNGLAGGTRCDDTI